MKKLFLILTLLLTINFAFGQALSEFKKVEKKDSTARVYSRVVLLPEKDIKNLLDILTRYPNLVMYDPAIPAQDKVTIYQTVQAYSKELIGKLKLDSVRTDTTYGYWRGNTPLPAKKAVIPKKK